MLDGATPPGQSAAVVSGDVTVYLPLAGMVDLDAERERLSKELAAVKAQIEKTEKMLGNESFVNRAKPDVVQRERDKLVDLQNTREAIEERLGALVG